MRQMFEPRRSKPLRSDKDMLKIPGAEFPVCQDERAYKCGVAQAANQELLSRRKQGRGKDVGEIVTLILMFPCRHSLALLRSLHNLAGGTFGDSGLRHEMRYRVGKQSLCRLTFNNEHR